MFTPKLRLLAPRMAALLLLLALTIGWVSLSSVRLSGADSPEKAKQKESPSLRLIHPEERESSGPIEQECVVEAYEQTAIYPQVPGFVERWNVDIGDRVKKGDVLAKLFAPEILEECEVKRAQVKVAEGRVELAKQALKVKQAQIKAAEARIVGAKAMLKANPPSREAAEAAVLVAEAELLEKKAALAQAEAAVKIAEAERAAAVSEAKKSEILVGYLTLTAPYDGVIVARNANTWDVAMPRQGDASGRSRTVSSGGAILPLYVIARTDVIRVFVDVPEEDAPFVRIGTKATVKIPSYDKKPIATVVARTSWALDEKSRTLRAEIDLRNPNGEILPGTSAYSKVFIKRERRVWALPVNALDESNNKIVYWEYKNGRALRREVQTGASDEKWIEIIRRRVPGSNGSRRWVPIDGSEKVIAGDLSSLTDGKAVKIADTGSSP